MSALFGVRSPRFDLVSEDWLTGYSAFLVKKSVYRDTGII